MILINQLWRYTQRKRNRVFRVNDMKAKSVGYMLNLMCVLIMWMYLMMIILNIVFILDPCNKTVQTLLHHSLL